MPIYEIRQGMRVTLDRDVYQVVAISPAGKVRLRHHNSGKYHTVSEQTILRTVITPEVDRLIAESYQPSKTKRQKYSGKCQSAAPSVYFNRLDLQVTHRAKGRTTTDQPWITMVMDAHTRCLLGFALVRGEEMVLRLQELQQELQPVEYDLFGDKTHLQPVGKGEAR
jgi:hypothetical protein